MNKYLIIEKNLEKLIRQNRPVVAIELNSIARSLSYPQSLDIILEIEQIILSNKAHPAAVGIIDGKLIAGLDTDQISYLLSLENLPKVSTRDISYFVSQKLSGIPTTAAAIFIAKMAGIKVLSTGAIGGVHRNADENFDISADLQQLSSSSMAVVCSGVNYIFDVPVTLEYLKTSGVPVIGYNTKVFPSFYVLDENIMVDYSLNLTRQIAELADIKWNLGLTGAVIIANPVPSNCLIDKDEMNIYIQAALDKAKMLNISRSRFTNYMIEEIDNSTNGKTKGYIIPILKKNSLLASIISSELADLYIE